MDEGALLRDRIERIVQSAEIVDVHTHLFPPRQSGLLLRGINELLTYHYLTTETLRFGKMSPEAFFSKPLPEQADEVWDTLFVERSPLSEACRGVVTVLSSYGIDPNARDLRGARAFFDGLSEDEHVDLVFGKANINFAVMTNDPFDDNEVTQWGSSFTRDSRFRTALRADSLISSPDQSLKKIRDADFSPGYAGYKVDYREVGNYLSSCSDIISPLYAALSLPPDFAWGDGSQGSEMMEKAILPFCRERGIPLALMIGVKRGVNPAMRLGGDGMGAADVSGITRMCRDNPDIPFMVTLLSRENQHELCVAARKFPNLMPFGCWWFLNIPSLVEETTRMRLELLGTSFIPQHSDARILDQLIYKWDHFKKILCIVLFDKYSALDAAGRNVTDSQIIEDVDALLSKNALKLFKLREETR